MSQLTGKMLSPKTASLGWGIRMFNIPTLSNFNDLDGIKSPENRLLQRTIFPALF